MLARSIFSSTNTESCRPRRVELNSRRYSIYVLESSTSRRMTYFMPPLVRLLDPAQSILAPSSLTFGQNLIPLVFLRPLRLFMRSEDARRIRIIVLKATHFPFVVAIWAYEKSQQFWQTHMRTPVRPLPPMTVNRPLMRSQSSLDRERDSLHVVSGRSALNKCTPVATPARTALAPVDTSELLSMVQKLSNQVDTLTAMVAGQQKD